MGMRDWARKILKISDPTGVFRNVPGSPEALNLAIAEEGNLGKNPYGSERAFGDIAGGGGKLSQDSKARTVGRAVGTIFAIYGASAALGVGGGAGVGTETGVVTGSAAETFPYVGAGEVTATQLSPVVASGTESASTSYGIWEATKQAAISTGVATLVGKVKSILIPSPGSSQNLAARSDNQAFNDFLDTLLGPSIKPTTQLSEDETTFSYWPVWLILAGIIIVAFLFWRK